MYEELEPAHTDPAYRSVFIHLNHIEIIAQESTHILKDAILWLQKVDLGEEIQDQVALDTIRLLECV